MNELGRNWPDGLSEEVAVVGADIQCIEDGMEVSFFRGCDDLDYYSYFVFSFERGYCAVMRYDHAKVPGVTIIIEKRHLSKLDEMIDYFIGELNLARFTVLWKRELR